MGNATEQGCFFAFWAEYLWKALLYTLSYGWCKNIWWKSR